MSRKQIYRVRQYGRMLYDLLTLGSDVQQGEALIQSVMEVESQSKNAGFKEFLSPDSVSPD